MKASPVPFVHLSEETKIIGANHAFRDLVGISAEELKCKTFYSLLDGPSRARYQVIAQCRRQKLLTPPYELTLICKTGTAHLVVVSGSALDMPRKSPPFKLDAPADTFLHTFGIVVPRESLSASEDPGIGLLSHTLSLTEFTQLATGKAHPA